MIITRKTHPAIFTAFREVDYDNGTINRFNPAKDEIEIPGQWALTVDAAEMALKALPGFKIDGGTTLPDSDFLTFCTGEYSEVEAIANRSSELRLAGELLNGYFDGWEVD